PFLLPAGGGGPLGRLEGIPRRSGRRDGRRLRPADVVVEDVRDPRVEPGGGRPSARGGAPPRRAAVVTPWRAVVRHRVATTRSVAAGHRQARRGDGPDRDRGERNAGPPVPPIGSSQRLRPPAGGPHPATTVLPVGSEPRPAATVFP